MLNSYVLDPRDCDELLGFYARLRHRRIEAKINSEKASQALGRNRGFIGHLESKQPLTPALSSLQLYGRALGLRVECVLPDFWDAEAVYADVEMVTAWNLSRSFEADMWARQWVVLALRAWRSHVGLARREVAWRLGIESETLRRWEHESTDPMLARLMQTARVMGTRLQLQVFSEKEWADGS